MDDPCNKVFKMLIYYLYLNDITFILLMVYDFNGKVSSTSVQLKPIGYVEVEYYPNLQMKNFQRALNKHSIVLIT